MFETKQIKRGEILFFIYLLCIHIFCKYYYDYDYYLFKLHVLTSTSTEVQL